MTKKQLREKILDYFEDTNINYRLKILDKGRPQYNSDSYFGVTFDYIYKYVLNEGCRYKNFVKVMFEIIKEGLVKVTFCTFVGDIVVSNKAKSGGGLPIFIVVNEAGIPKLTYRQITGSVYELLNNVLIKYNMETVTK